MKGHFVVQKSSQPFSSIALEQAHEHNNESVKGDGGAVGLFQREDSLLKWMIGGPELARVIFQFE